MEEHGIFYKCSEISKIYGIPLKMVQNYCHARGQRFATKLKPNGRFFIDRVKFDEWLARKQEKTI